MTKRFEFKGQWKLPNEEDWYNGILVFDPDFGSTLEIFGTFNPGIFDRNSKDIILGKTDEGDITLVDNWYRSKKSVHNGVTIGTYRPTFIVNGHHFSDSSQIKFREVIFRVFNLFQWLNLTGLDTKIENNSNSYEIKYEAVPNIDFDIRNDLKGSISFDGPITTNGPNNEIELHEAAYVNFYYDDPQDFKFILTDISKFIGFITLLTFEQSYPIYITFKDLNFTDEIYRVKQKKYISCFFEHNDYTDKHKIRFSGQHLVSYASISGAFPEILKKWFELYDTTEEVVMLILNHFKTKYKFNERKFVDVVQALESYHRIHYSNQRIPNEKFASLVQNILDQVKLEEDDLEWLKQRLTGNEPNLKTRIEVLIKSCSSEFLNEKIPKANKFCRQTVDSRNYYTHYDPKNRKYALTGSNLSEITRINRAIVISCLLKQIGIPVELFDQGLKQHLG